jgi:hypothetical protein
LTGKIVGDAYFSADADTVLAHYQHISETRDIRFVETPFVAPRGWYVYAERIMMPLSVDDDTVRMVFIYALWTDAPEN